MASACCAAPALGAVAGREARGPLAPSPADASCGVERGSKGAEGSSCLAVAEWRRQTNHGRPGLLPALCPAPPCICRRLRPVSAPRCLKNRAGCTACLSLPAHPTHGWASHTHPTAPGHILPHPHLAPAWLSGQRSHRHVVHTCLPASPCRRTNSSFGFGLTSLKGKAAVGGSSSKPFPAAQ